MNNSETLQIIADCVVGSSIALLVCYLCFGRTMLVVLGSQRQVRAGFFRALFLLCRDYFGGYSNTLFVRDGCIVKVRQEEREFRKNRPAKSVLIFEVEL